MCSTTLLQFQHEQPFEEIAAAEKMIHLKYHTIIGSYEICIITGHSNLTHTYVNPGFPQIFFMEKER